MLSKEIPLPKQFSILKEEEGGRVLQEIQDLLLHLKILAFKRNLKQKVPSVTCV